MSRLKILIALALVLCLYFPAQACWRHRHHHRCNTPCLHHSHSQQGVNSEDEQEFGADLPKPGDIPQIPAIPAID